MNSNDSFIQKISKKFSKKNKENNKEKKKKPKILTIVGVDNKAVLNAIDNQLTVDIVNPTAAERKFWIDYNINEIYKILYSYGYFDAKVEPFNGKTIKKFKITLNKRYKLKEIIFNYTCNGDYKKSFTLKKIFNLMDIKPNSYFNTQILSSGISNVKDYYKRRGFAFVSIEKPEIEIDSKNKTVKAIYTINLGPKTIINNTIINITSKKSPKLLESFIRNRINWEKNDIYNIDTFSNFKEDLVKYDLFSTIDINIDDYCNNIKHNDSDDKNNICLDNEPCDSKHYLNNIHTNHSDINNSVQSDIIVDIKEAPLREKLAGINFNTTDLFGVVLGWKHHNIDGKASNIALQCSLDKNAPKIEFKHNTYDIFLPRQCLSSQIFGEREKNTSYETKKFGIESILWQTITRYLEIGIGANWELSSTIDKVSDTKNKQSKYIHTVGIPINIKFDNTNNNLDPQNGCRLDVKFTPSFLNKSNYNSVLGKFSTYIGFKPKDAINNNLVLAFYAKYGTILNNNNLTIPISKLFFSGGVDSIRGYGNKKVGPLDETTKKPTGGNSIFEFGIEPRFRLNNNMCLTAFIEAGKVFDRANDKSLLKDLMYGYGVGLVYYTPIAPIRINIAFPTKRRKNNKNKYIDSWFQIYISVGQAF